MKASKERQVSSTRTGPPTCSVGEIISSCVRRSATSTRSRSMYSVLFTEIALAWSPASHSHSFSYEQRNIADLAECSKSSHLDAEIDHSLFLIQLFLTTLFTSSSSMRLPSASPPPDTSWNTSCTSLPATIPAKFTLSPPSPPLLFLQYLQ